MGNMSPVVRVTSTPSVEAMINLVGPGKIWVWPWSWRILHLDYFRRIIEGSIKLLCLAKKNYLAKLLLRWQGSFMVFVCHLWWVLRPSQDCSVWFISSYKLWVSAASLLPPLGCLSVMNCSVTKLTKDFQSKLPLSSQVIDIQHFLIKHLTFLWKFIHLSLPEKLWVDWDGWH